MSGHTNRNKRNKRSGGNPPKRGPDGRPGQSSQSSQSGPLNQPGQASQSKPTPGSSISGSEKQPRVEATAQSVAESATPPAQLEPHEAPATATPAGESPTSAEPAIPAEQAGAPSPRGKTSFAAARGTHAYIPASGPRMGMNGAGGSNSNAGHNGHGGQNGANGQAGQQTQPGQSGQNGYHRVEGSLNGNGHNGYAPIERRPETFAATDSAGMDDDGEGDFAGPVPQTWRTERLNGGTDATPREPFRPESRGEVGALIDTLHDLFAQDRAIASRGDATRCGICYLHFPLADLEYREAEGFYVCSGCKRALGHLSLMMIRRQQTPHNG